MRALIIDDMLTDFVDGKLANPNAQAIVEPLQRLLEHARDEGWVVVYSNDAHHPEDAEVQIWGEHAMAGTPGAEVIPQLRPRDDDIVSPKRVYGGFEGTGLDQQLKERGVDEVVITGQHTHICVRHTAYGAMVHGYEIVIPRDGVCAWPDVDPDEALEYLEAMYGARLTTVDELTGDLQHDGKRDVARSRTGRL